MSTSTTSSTGEPVTLLRTPFHDFHVNHGGKMVPFAGWEMPIRYGSIIEEHHQVRRSGGLFDVSHMGRLRFTGRDARKFLDLICTRQIIDMQDGMCRYSLVCNEKGGCRDDVLVYRLSDSEYIMVCNASNRLKLLAHFDEIRGGGDMKFKLVDETESTAMVALQGPKVMGLIAGFSSEIPALKRYRFTVKKIPFIAEFIISRTGYTGEDGVEAILPAKFADRAVDMLLKNVTDPTLIKPAGLGARDSLRLEAGMPLYGHEIEEHLDPIAAGLNFAVKLDKSEDAVPGGFIGQAALQRIAREGPERKLVGFVLEGKRAARQNMRIMSQDGGREVGFVTSGCWSPTLEKSIAMGYVESPLSAPGNAVLIDPEKLNVPAAMCPLPFYKSA